MPASHIHVTSLNSNSTVLEKMSWFSAPKSQGEEATDLKELRAHRSSSKEQGVGGKAAPSLVRLRITETLMETLSESIK